MLYNTSERKSKRQAHLQSLDGGQDTVTIYPQSNGTYIAEYPVDSEYFYTAIFNVFNCRFYVDDVNGFISEISFPF